jgi:O-antigen/teichoic acid export membrane protein
MTTELANDAMTAASVEVRTSTWRRLHEVAGRYGLSASGALSISGAHFIASLILLRALPPAEFGLFSFALIVVPFCLGMSGALLGASVAATIARAKAIAEPELATHLKASLALSGLITVAIGGLMLLSGGDAMAALLFGLYGGSMTLRWFARSYAYALNQRYRVTFSDFAYGGLLLIGLFVLLKIGQFNILNAAAVFVFASVAALLVFGADYLKKLLASSVTGSLRAYGSIWRELTRWSLLGVVLTEITANAHAYLVTFISGPKAFALLAVGSLFMRPVSLCLTALPDLERPIMARHIAGGEVPRARRSVFEFRAATAVVWIVTATLAIVLLLWFPHLVLKSGYDQSEAFIVLGFWAAIMAVRIFRTPESVFLQAASEFRPLAGASVRSSVVSLVLTFALLLIAGPIASLGGVLIGDLVMAAKISSLSRVWRRGHD